MELSLSADFKEGNVVVAGPRVRIRVHRTVLSLQSGYFRRLLTVHPESAGDNDNPPAIHLPQTDTDIIHYAGAIYNITKHVCPRLPVSALTSLPLRSDYVFIEKQEIDVLASVLRTSIAFDNSQLRDHAMIRLKTEYPSYLQDWDRGARRGFTRIQQTPSVHFEALLLSRELHIYSVIPAILYDICAAHTMVRGALSI